MLEIRAFNVIPGLVIDLGVEDIGPLVVTAVDRDSDNELVYIKGWLVDFPTEPLKTYFESAQRAGELEYDYNVMIEVKGVSIDPHDPDNTDFGVGNGLGI